MSFCQVPTDFVVDLPMEVPPSFYPPPTVWVPQIDIPPLRKYEYRFEREKTAIFRWEKERLERNKEAGKAQNKLRQRQTEDEKGTENGRTEWRHSSESWEGGSESPNGPDDPSEECRKERGFLSDVRSSPNAPKPNLPPHFAPSPLLRPVPMSTSSASTSHIGTSSDQNGIPIQKSHSTNNTLDGLEEFEPRRDLFDILELRSLDARRELEKFFNFFDSSTMDGLTLAELFQFTSLNAQNEFSLRTVCALLERRKTVESYDADEAAASHEVQPVPPSSSTEEWFLRFATILRPSLRSPFGFVRLRSLQLLLQLWPFGGRATNSGSESLENAKMLANPIGMLIEAEQCEVSFHSYRQRAQFFRRLKRNNLLALLPSEDEAFRELMEKLVLDVLLAQLYERLTLYWPLLTESIESYAQSLDLFWDCFGFALDFAWDALSEEQNGRNEDEVDKTVGCNTAVNFGSFRVQLLRLLGKLPSARSELRTRYLSPKLITLYRDEFMQFDEPFPTTSSKPVKGKMDSEAQQLCEENGGEEERENDFVDTDDDNLEPSKKDFCPKIGKESAAVKPLRFRVGRRNAVQAIKALLAVYGRFSNPRGVFREREIHEIYYELLLVNEAEVQRAALGCLLTYKYAWLTPYKTHLEALLDPRQLRDHLVLFVVDNRRDADDLLDEHSLTDQHRPELIPVLIRLLYGSLYTHVATRGKTKRLAIFRFLANCHSDELGLFLQLIFGPLFSFFETNDENDAISGLERAFSSLDSKMDVVRSMSLNKLKSSLGSLSDVFHFLGPFLSDAQLALLFASIVLIARILLQHSSQRFRQKENQMDGDGTASMERFLKSLRKVLFLTLIKFFRAFQSRPNLPISAFHSLFQQFLGPLISDFNEGRVFTSKCLSLPVSAIRLFCTWGQINRYFPLLNVPLSIDFADSDSICHSIVTTPMALLCDQLFLLRSSATKSTIQMDILRVVCSMLDSHDENTLESAKIAESSAADLITVLPQVPLEMPEMNAIPAAFGVSLVLSNGQLDKILGYMSNFVNIAGGQLGSKVADQMSRIPTIYFDLLSRLSSHIQRPELASMFAHTLLRFVTSKNGLMLKRRPDRAVVVLATLGRLAPHLEDPLDAVARLSPLFSHLEGRQLRWALTQMAFSIRENPCLPSGAKNLIDLLEALESWDLRRIEDPDADRRCEALLRLHDWYEQRNRHVLLEDGAAHTLPLLAHSHVHSMLQNSDISLRGTAANTFRQLIQFVADPPTAAKGNFDVVRMLRSHFIPLILRGLRASVEDESARHEFIQCLASLARCFPNEPQLTSFRLIIGSMAPASAEFVVDPDIDFFECAMHIQLHRRQRAFHRLAERLNSGELSVGHSLLLRFIVPIVQPYLMDTAPNRSALSDQALHLFSSILRRTPWPKYCQMLDHFLRQLDTVEEMRTKGAIRVVSAVLNAFHFDLRHLQINDQKKRGEYNGGREVGNDEGNVEGMEEDDEEVVERDEQQKESDQRESDGIGKSDEEEKRRIFGVVKGRLLPRLRECLHNWSGANKPGSNWDLEEQKLLRAPLTLAVVKLLEWLPPHVAEQHLHGLVLFLKHLLMSRSASTRQNARKLLEQMVCLLGPAKLPFVLREVKQALNKGYQMHVMVVTVHALIGALEGHLASGDMEPVLREVVDVCRWETFGSNNDKYGTAGGDVDRRSDSHGVPEARASGKRTGHTLTIVGRFVAKLDLLEQYVFAVMRDIANTNSRSETVRKLADWLRALNVGLRINAAIGSREQLRWALRLFDENLRLMSADERRLSQMNGESSTAVGRRPANCLLLPPEPKRLGVIQRVAVKSKVHIFVEFALQILVDQLAKLRHLLPNSGEVGGNCDDEEEHDNRDKCEEENKKNDKIFEDKLKASDLQQIVPLLEQFVPLIIEALKQKYDKVIALSLRALLHLFKCPQLFLANERIEKLVDLFFVLLADYSSVGSAEHRSNVLELQQQLFKCFTQVIRNISPTLLNGDRLQLLFNYVETDILDVHKQTTAFNLVKAIIGRKIEDKSLTNIVTYLSELAITSPSANIRSQCRQTVLLYLTVHPRGQRQYERWMDFFLNQCEYELEEGRLSALEMVHSIISEFTEEANARYALLVHLKLCVRLLNDDSVRCRQFVALALRRLLCSVTPSAFNDCLAATNDWLAAKKPQIRLLAWRAFSQFIASECQHFGPTQLRQIVRRACHSFSISTKLFVDQSDTTKLALSQKVDQILVKSRHSSKCRRTSVNFDEEISSTNRRQKTTIWPQFFVNLDHCLGRCQRNALNLPLSFAAGAFVAKLTEFTECREEIVKHLSGQGAEDLPLDYSPLCSLCLNLITQIDPKPPGKIVRSKVNVGEAVVEETEEDGENVRQNGGGRWDNELAEQAVRSLATLMPSLSGAHFELTCKKLSKLCWAEAVTESDSARKRLTIFKLIGALAVNIPSVISEQFSHLCSYFISIIYREMSKKSSKYTEELHSLAVEVGGELRRRIGDREFTSRLAKCQRERTERVQRRKSDAKTLFVTNPVAALVDKQRRHERKKEARRRRLDIRKPYRALKRRRKTANGNTNERNEL
uniref:Uncharacterized protein n=1 Tax=Globodera rostochiensis TaxID=31243 RepID=A0A914HMA1_GLORO